MKEAVRGWLRRRPLWVQFQAVNREGWGNAVRRWRVAPAVLSTPPVRTGPAGPVGAVPAAEVHVMVWDRDVLPGLWAAKSFYAASRVDWPLYWHQGGPLSGRSARRLAEHFPDSRLVGAAEADERVGRELRGRGLTTCLAARGRSFMLRKFFDPLLVGRADYLLLLDTDVLFFARPDELLQAVADRTPASLFNRDKGYWYNLTAAAARDRYGIDLQPQVNAGLTLLRRAGADLELADRLLADEDLFRDPWLTEQTLQALLASRHGLRLLSDLYHLDTGPGLATADGRPVVAKHYPGHPRPWLYREGMPHLLEVGMLGRGGRA